MVRTFFAKVLRQDGDKLWVDFDLGFQQWKTQLLYLVNQKVELTPRNEISVNVTQIKEYDYEEHKYVYRYEAEVMDIWPNTNKELIEN